MEKNVKNDRNNTLMGYFPENESFIVELKFTKDNNETAEKLLRSAVNGFELLPDLVVSKLYRGIETINTVTNIKKREVFDEMVKALEQFKQDVINFKFEEIDTKEYGTEYIGKL